MINTKHQTFEQAMTASSARMQEVFEGSPSVVKPQMRHLCDSAGKQLRAGALLACAMDPQGLIHPDAAELAAAIELLHLATLVHDDIIDDAEIRRGKLSLQKKFGQKTAVLCGDYLLCMAMNMALSVSDRDRYKDKERPGRKFPRYLTALCLGELNEWSNNNNFQLSLKEYLKIINGKTASLFEAAFRLGAIVGGEDDIEIEKYSRIGHFAGMMFQLFDDCNDFLSTAQRAGKPVLSDIAKGVITLPVIFCISKDASVTEMLHDAAESGEIKNKVISSGGVDFTKKLAIRYYTKADELVKTLSAGEQKKHAVSQIIAKMNGSLERDVK